MNTSFANDAFEVTGDWKFEHGNESQWKSQDFDDRLWERVEVPKLLFQGHEKPVMGWYRVKFDVIKPVKDQLALHIETIRHADETWLNGTRIGGIGTTYGAWDFLHTNPQSLPRLYKIPDALLKEKNNVLAIKVNVGFGEAWGAMFPGGAGITKGKVYIGDYQKLQQEIHYKELKIITLDTVFAALGVLDLLIILLLIKTALGSIPEFKWLLMTSFFLLLGASAHDINFVYSIDLISTNFALVTAMLVLPFTTAMYFWSQYRDIPRNIIVGMTLLWGVNILVILFPNVPFSLKNICWYIWNAQAAIFFLYSIYAAFKGIVYKRLGAVAQLLGIVIYVFSIRSQWLPEEFFGHRNIQIGSVFYRYALLVAYFQQMAGIRINYKQLNYKLVGIVENVRHSIARELHDGIGQYLASIKLQTKLAEKSGNPNYSLIYKQLDDSILGLRRLINGLHPVVIDEVNISKALEIESRNIMKTYDVSISVNALDLNFHKTIEAYIFRIFQECVANSIKHGDAKEIKVKLQSGKEYIKVSIEDDGKGFLVNEEDGIKEESGYGLISIHERVALLNGSLDVRSVPNQGTCVKFMIPLKGYEFTDE